MSERRVDWWSFRREANRTSKKPKPRPMTGPNGGGRRALVKGLRLRVLEEIGQIAHKAIDNTS